MSVNKYQQHILILPEDDANRAIVNGFFLQEMTFRNPNTYQVLPEAGGWRKVLDSFLSDHVINMRKLINRSILLVVDFDDEDRYPEIEAKIPLDLRDRVFILGSRGEPEELRSTMGTFESIGITLEKDCRDGTLTSWNDPILQHNLSELKRLRAKISALLG